MMECSLFHFNFEKILIITLFPRLCPLSSSDGPMLIKEILRLKLIVMNFFLFSCLQFFRYTTKEQDFKIPQMIYLLLQICNRGFVRHVRSTSGMKQKLDGRPTRCLQLDQHIDMIINLYLFPSDSLLALYFKNHSTNFHENFSFLVFMLNRYKINPAQNHVLKNIKWTYLEEGRNETSSFSF